VGMWCAMGLMLRVWRQRALVRARSLAALEARQGVGVSPPAGSLPDALTAEQRV